MQSMLYDHYLTTCDKQFSYAGQVVWKGSMYNKCDKGLQHVKCHTFNCYFTKTVIHKCKDNGIVNVSTCYHKRSNPYKCMADT